MIPRRWFAARRLWFWAVVLATTSSSTLAVESAQQQCEQERQVRAAKGVRGDPPICSMADDSESEEPSGQVALAQQCAWDRRARAGGGLAGEPASCRLLAGASLGSARDDPLARNLVAVLDELGQRESDDYTMCGVMLCQAAPGGPQSIRECDPFMRKFRSTPNLPSCPMVKQGNDGTLMVEDSEDGSGAPGLPQLPGRGGPFQ